MNSVQIAAAQNEVKDVVGVMKNNIDKVLERDSKLHDLDDRAASLEANSGIFQQSSARLRRKYWYQNMKLKVCLGGAGVILVIIIIIAIVVHVKNE
ncbi:synaptobrevin [Eurytemora carolleeae]|uniref:synaptobrevin n=1 Tax=Eurytemora carolleeae TaxID=1294199 RepID=UPI000C76F328|nr:synaptobrevin [Eurytemora carolleeae]|eukprot:XP_023336107.1 synaptobrevin-like [Eurytemora affinis]